MKKNYSITIPPGDVITLSEAKLFCRIESSYIEEDSILQGMIFSAVEYSETFMWRKIPEQTWLLEIDSWPEVNVFISSDPRVSSIEYVDTLGNPQTLDTSIYYIRYGRLWLEVGEEFPEIQDGSKISITYKRGFESLPSDIKSGLLSHIWHQFEYRDGRSIPYGIEQVYCKYRIIDFFANDETSENTL